MTNFNACFRNKHFALLFFLAVALFVLIKLRKLSSSQNTSSDADASNSYFSKKRNFKTKCLPWLRWVDAYRKCLASFLETKKAPDVSAAWDYTHEAIVACSGGAIMDMLNIKILPNKDDSKMIILPGIEPFTSKTCTEVTLGVGNDTGAEERLVALLPECQFYGADPFRAAGAVFESVGKYYEFAVAGRSGRQKANVLVGPNIYNYAAMEVPTVSFVDFLTKYVNKSKIDYLFMDNEGAEYEVLPMFYKRAVVQRRRLMVCQISVELHGPLATYNMTGRKYDALILSLTLNSSLIPLWSSAPQNHARMFLLNADDEYCVEKYVQQFCVN